MKVDTTAIARTWAAISSTDRVYVVASERGVFIESPDDQALSDRDVQEGLLRVFAAPESAKAYKKIIEIISDPLSIWFFDLEAFWTKLKIWNEACLEQMRCPLRATICAINSDGWAETIDDLWRTGIILH